MVLSFIFTILSLDRPVLIQSTSEGITEELRMSLRVGTHTQRRAKPRQGRMVPPRFKG